MGINISWTGELVQGAEAELKTVLKSLEAVYLPKLENFILDLTGGAATQPPPTTGLPPIDSPPVTPPVPEQVVVLPPIAAAPPVGNVVDTSTGVATDPTGAVVEQEPTAVDPTAPVVATPPTTLEAKLAAMSPETRAALADLLGGS